MGERQKLMGAKEGRPEEGLGEREAFLSIWDFLLEA